PTAETLSGSKMLVANAEVHAPLIGLFRGTLDYGALPIELAAFLDSGVTWTSATRPSVFGGNRDLLRRAGGAARINAFSLLLIEIAASHPFDGINHGWRWQVGLRGGF